MLKYEKLLWDNDNMQDENTQRLLELQMKELKETYGLDSQEDAPAPKEKSSAKNPKDAKLAEMYADAAEYENELESFETELEVINENALKDIPDALGQKFPQEERNFAKELQAVLVAHWTSSVETNKPHAVDQLALVTTTDFGDVVEVLSAAYPDVDFEKEVRDILVKRWGVLISIKKEHIEEEMEEIYIAGLKPSFVKRIYKRYHGL